MDDRSDLAIRAEVLNKLADQLSEQLAVERRANDELRSLLREGPTMSVPRERPASFAPIVTTLAVVAVAVTICVGVAASWSRAGVGPTACPTRFAAAVSAAAPASMVGLRAQAPAEPAAPTDFYPNGPAVTLPVTPTGNPRDCGAITNARAARCFVDASGGSAAGEYMTRNLILAHTLLGQRGQGRVVAARYLEEHAGSPFVRQIRQLGY